MQSRKKTIFITIIITALVTFIATNAIYVVIALMTSHGLKLELAKGIILEKYIDPSITEDQLTDTAIFSMMESIKDKYGRYLTGENYKNVLASMTQDEFLGLGIVIVPNEHGAIVVAKTYENTPAQKAGIIKDDIILKIDGQDINEENYTAIISPIKQKKEGDTVLLTIQKIDSGQTEEISLTLEKIHAQTVLYEQISAFGYIRILEFSPGANNDFNRAVDNLLSSDVKGLILDLRNNPGGLVSEVVSITDRILPEGVIATVRNKNGDIIKTYSSDKNGLDLPIVVLINENTASAAEFLTGALVDFGAAKTVGTKSYGKAVGQSLYPIGKDSGLYLTDSKFYLPRGESIDGVGIEPDYKIDLPAGTDIYMMPKNQDPQIKKALELFLQAS